MRERLLLTIAVLLVCPALAFANYLDITTSLSDSGTFGPATFRGDFTQPAGTGVFQPFWRAQQHGNDTTYEFFNTDARPLSGDLAPGNNANGGNIKNRTFLVSSLTEVNGNYVFLLDTNEPNSAAKSLISMDKFVIRTSSSNTLSTFANLASANLIYDMDGSHACAASSANGSLSSCVADASNGVLLTEALNPGSGKTNLAVLVPNSLFAGHLDEYFYLDVQFGLRQNASADGSAEAGFEEWSALRGTTATPEPSTYLFLALAMGGVLVCNAKKNRRSAPEKENCKTPS